MKCNIVPLRQNWRDWELHHNKSNGYYSPQFTFSLPFYFTHYFSPSPPFTSSSIFILSLSLSLPRCASKVRITSCTRICTVGCVQILHLLKDPAPASRKEKKITKTIITSHFAIRSVSKRPIAFQLPGLNLKANDGGEPLSLHLKKNPNKIKNQARHFREHRAAYGDHYLRVI